MEGLELNDHHLELLCKQIADSAAEIVLAALNEKYILVEKTFNMDQKTTVDMRKEMFMDNVLSITANHFGISPEEIKGGPGARLIKEEGITYSEVRIIVYSICRILPEAPISYEVLRKFFNKKTHVTIQHAMTQKFDGLKEDIVWRKHYQQIVNKVNESLKL